MSSPLISPSILSLKDGTTFTSLQYYSRSYITIHNNNNKFVAVQLSEKRLLEENTVISIERKSLMRTSI